MECIAVAKIDESVKDIIKPGVILYPLDKSKGNSKAKEQNPLFPYYLWVYIADDGEVKAIFSSC